jgi:hypothetical protein
MMYDGLLYIESDQSFAEFWSVAHLLDFLPAAAPTLEKININEAMGFNKMGKMNEHFEDDFFSGTEMHELDHLIPVSSENSEISAIDFTDMSSLNNYEPELFCNKLDLIDVGQSGLADSMTTSDFENESYSYNSSVRNIAADVTWNTPANPEENLDGDEFFLSSNTSEFKELVDFVNNDSCKTLAIEVLGSEEDDDPTILIDNGNAGQAFPITLTGEAYLLINDDDAKNMVRNTFFPTLAYIGGNNCSYLNNKNIQFWRNKFRYVIKNHE